MSLDIHMFIEYRSEDSKSKEFKSFSGSIKPRKDYNMFGILSGIRNAPPDFFSAKGLPDVDTLGEMSKYAQFKRVDKQEQEDSKFDVIQCNGESLVARSIYTHHSWLTVPELEYAFSLYDDYLRARSNQTLVDATYIALLECMKALERGGNEVRVVFWFDI